MVELLAPAKDIEKLKIAFLYGADAVYIGGRDFSLRANATNFSLEEIKEAVKYAHQHHKKVYVTVNIVFHEEDLVNLEQYLIELAKIKVDAIIASDIYVLDLIAKKKIDLVVHLSTQASVTNAYAAKYYMNYNVKRIVLARETSLEDIKDIKKQTNLELECFIHGAMCTGISGRCILSNVITNRDANRGGCAQICRFTFDNQDKVPFTMSSKDLNLIDYIKDMIDVGVNSFKVEGRMRGIYYIATVINCYRKIIDKILDNTLTPDIALYYLKILNRCANRDSTSQFIDKIPTENEQYFSLRDEQSNQDFLGIVKDYDEKKHMVILEQRNFFKLGDIGEFFGPNLQETTYTINKMYDENDEEIQLANHPRMIVKLPVDFSLQPFDMLRIKTIDKDSYLL